MTARGRRVLVTGASSGIGGALSARLASEGCRVVGVGRSFASPCDHLEAALVRDLTEPGAPASVVTEAVAVLGGLDIVVSNAGAGWSGHFSSMTEEQIDALLDINLRSHLHLARAAASHLLASRGHLVLVGSIAGLIGVPEEVAYGAAKAGLRGLADGLRAEWPSVTVTLVSPGVVATPFFSRRNRPYARSWPKPVPAARVATAIARAIDHRRSAVIVPSWLGLATRLNGGLPALYRALSPPTHLSSG